MAPLLHVRFADGTGANLEQSAPLRGAQDRLSFNLPRDLLRPEAEVWLAGSSGDPRIEWMEIAGMRLTRVTAHIDGMPAPGPGLAQAEPPPLVPAPYARPPLAPPPPPAPTPAPDWSRSPSVVKACGDAFAGTRQNACFEAVAGVRFNPVRTIAACERALAGPGNQLECVRVAVRSPVEPLALLAACERAMGGPANILACLEPGVRASYDLVPAVRACSNLMVGPTPILDCVRAAAGSSLDVSASIRACSAMTGNDGRLQCVRRVSAPGR